MSDVTHSRKAEEMLLVLKDPDSADKAGMGELALIHAVLATPRALREIDTTIRIGLEKIASHVKGPAPAQMVVLESPDGSPVWFNAVQFVAVTPDPDNPDSQTLLDVADRSYVVAGNVHEVSARIFQVVGSW